MPRNKKTKSISTKSSFNHAELQSIKYNSYFEVYNRVLKPYIGKPVTLLEIGVLNGGGLMTWRDFLGKKARIIGVDLNPKARQFEKFGFEIYIGDQSDSKFWKSFLHKNKNLDIVIDDGGHTNYQQINTMTCLLPKIREGGIYVVEDLHCSYLPSFANPSQTSTINSLIAGIHSINSRSPLLSKRENVFSSQAHSITFFESIAVIDVLSRNKLENKRVKNQGTRLVDKDYRLEGFNPYFLGLGSQQELEINSMSRIRNKIRVVVQTLVLKFQNRAVKNLFRQL
jgi:hypothetical protein